MKKIKDIEKFTEKLAKLIDVVCPEVLGTHVLVNAEFNGNDDYTKVRKLVRPINVETFDHEEFYIKVYDDAVVFYEADGEEKCYKSFDFINVDGYTEQELLTIIAIHVERRTRK